MVIGGEDIGKVKVSENWTREERNKVVKKITLAIAHLSEMRRTIEVMPPAYLEANRENFSEFLE